MGGWLEGGREENALVLQRAETETETACPVAYCFLLLTSFWLTWTGKGFIRAASPRPARLPANPRPPSPRPLPADARGGRGRGGSLSQPPLPPARAEGQSRASEPRRGPAGAAGLGRGSGESRHAIPFRCPDTEKRSGQGAFPCACLKLEFLSVTAFLLSKYSSK